MIAVADAPRQLQDVAPAVATSLRGVHLLNEHSLSYEPAVKVTDVLEVDFDQHQIGADGLYVTSYPDGWCGVRRFQHMPISGLQIFEGDEWIKIHKGHRGMQVVGRVLNVYRRVQA